MSSHISMEERFDLDMALTTHEGSSLQEMNSQPELLDAQSTAMEQMVEEMPAVVAGSGCCAVCMEGFPMDTCGGKQVPCGHIFHSNCISRWLCLHNSCPLCRSQVTGVTAVDKLIL